MHLNTYLNALHFPPSIVKLLSSSLSYCEEILLLGLANFLPDYCKGNVISSCLQYYTLTNLLNLHKIASTQTFGPRSLTKYLAKSHKLQVFNADGILKPGLGESLASHSVLSDTPKDYLRSPNSCYSGPSRPENAAQLVHVQPPAENKVDGVMEGALESEGEGDEAPSAEIEIRHRGKTEGVI